MQNSILPNVNPSVPVRRSPNAATPMCQGLINRQANRTSSADIPQSTRSSKTIWMSPLLAGSQWRTKFILWDNSEWVQVPPDEYLPRSLDFRELGIATDTTPKKSAFSKVCTRGVYLQSEKGYKMHRMQNETRRNGRCMEDCLRNRWANARQ